MSTYGFTGTQLGMAARQRKAVRQLLYHATTLHLGDCVGADAQAHEIAHEFGVKTIGHPPSDKRKRAFLRYDWEWAELPYLARNKRIVVDGVDGLIAAPYGYTEVLRSGTWATIREARKLRRRIWIVLPDGKIKDEVEG